MKLDSRHFQYKITTCCGFTYGGFTIRKRLFYYVRHMFCILIVIGQFGSCVLPPSDPKEILAI